MIAEEFLNSGLDKRKKGDNRGAIEDYTKAIKLKPDFAGAYYNRGIVYKIQGDKKTAIKDFQKAAELYQQQGNTEWYQNAINKVKKLEK